MKRPAPRRKDIGLVLLAGSADYFSRRLYLQCQCLIEIAARWRPVWRLIPMLFLFAFAGNTWAQENTPIEATPQHRSWLGRILHPFSSEPVPQYRDPRLRGLAIDLQITPQTVKLSEVRQLAMKVTLSNRSKRTVALEFLTNQRIEIYLENSAGQILTKWSDNHAIGEKPGTILINPREHVEYNETIATRELTPNKVFTAEVFFPQYPELRVRQKFLAVP